ncbi:MULTISPECIES: hypothetical protein [Streptomyces]
MAHEYRTYHGTQGAGFDEDEWQPARLLVEKPEPAPPSARTSPCCAS